MGVYDRSNRVSNGGEGKVFVEQRGGGLEVVGVKDTGGFALVFDRVIVDWGVDGVWVRSMEGPLRGGGGVVGGQGSRGRTGGLIGFLFFLGAGSGVGGGGCGGGSGSSCVQLFP